MFKYLWQAHFENDGFITQPHDDRYSKHDDTAEHNPSAFRDVLEYSENVSPLVSLSLHSEQGEIYAVDLRTGEFFINGSVIMLDQPLEELTDRKIIYFRTKRMNMQTGEQYVYAYNIGYEGKDSDGKIAKKVITVR